MAKSRTAQQHEKHLNVLLFSNLTEEDAVDNYEYLASKNRSPRTTISHIRNCYAKRELGTLLRRLDPIAFNCSMRD